MLVYPNERMTGDGQLNLQQDYITADVDLQPFEEAAFLAFSQREPGLSQEAARRKQARELTIAVRCVSIVGETLSHDPQPWISHVSSTGLVS